MNEKTKYSLNEVLCFLNARSFAITLYLSPIAEQGTEVPCLDRGRVVSLVTGFNGRHYSTEGYYYCDDDGK